MINLNVIIYDCTCNANLPIVVTIHWSGELAERDLQRQSAQLLFFILGGLPWFAYRSASPLYTILTVASLQSSQQNVWYTLLSPFGARVILNTVEGKCKYTNTDNICPFNYIFLVRAIYTFCVTLGRRGSWRTISFFTFLSFGTFWTDVSSAIPPFWFVHIDHLQIVIQHYIAIIIQFYRASSSYAKN